jgi:phosphoribosylamine---glycine ligase
MFDCATGQLQPAAVEIDPGFAVIVVLAAAGYPGDYSSGDAITLPTALPDNVQIVHAGTRRRPDGTLETAGGRVLGVVARADSLAAATAAAYTVADAVQWPGRYFRRDIAWRQLQRG